MTLSPFGRQTAPSVEHARLAESPDHSDPWRLWGPYLAGRQWGTVREDYSADGDAWAYFPFDQAHRRAYRWGEDGIAGLCDRLRLPQPRRRAVERRRTTASRSGCSA